MKNALRLRFWFETGMAVVTGIVFVITLVQRDWIETLFKIDPDNGGGTLEWLIVATLLVTTVTLFALASYEWRRTRAAIS